MARERARIALRWGAVLAAVLLVAPRARADEEFAVDVKDPLVRVRAELDLFVNETPAGTALVVLERGDALILPSDLERAGLVVRGGRRIRIDDRELVSLRSLEPKVTFVVDERALALRITAAPELLGRRTLDLRPSARPADVEQRFDSSAFLDYAVDSDLANHYGLAFHGGGRIGRWLATTDVTRAMEDGHWARGMSAAVRDDVPSLQRLTVGDTFSTTGALGGGALLGGVTFAREFSLDPYLVLNPYPTTTAIIAAPSTLEVYVNGQLVRQQTLAPGYWNVANLPVPAGQAFVHAVIRDAFGRERTIDNRFYFSSGLLAPGYSDYALSAGFRRESFGQTSFDYGPPAASARYRFGANEWFTPGVRAEVASDVASGGGGATFGTRAGEFQIDASASGATGRLGGAAQLGWSWIAGQWSAALHGLAQSDRYATLAMDATMDRPVLDSTADVAVTLFRRVGLGVEAHAGRWRDLGRYATAGLRGSTQVESVALNVSADYGNIVGGRVGVQALVLLAWVFAGHTADASLSRDTDGKVMRSTSITRPLLRDSSVAYRAHATEQGGTSAFDGMLQGQSTFGRAEIDAVRTGMATTWHANASGGLVYMDRGLYLTRPTAGSFALVDAGVPDVLVSAENIPYGRTGSDGKLLVPELQAYYATKLSIQEKDLPLEYEPGKTEQRVAPPYLGGALVRFSAQRISAITGQLAVRLHDRDERPANGELSAIVDGELRTSPITEDGRFFLERMPPGKHVVQAIWGGGSCRAAITLPQKAPPVFDAGEVRCIPDVLEPGGRIPKLTDPGYADGAFPPDLEKGAGAGGP